MHVRVYMWPLSFRRPWKGGGVLIGVASVAVLSISRMRLKVPNYYVVVEKRAMAMDALVGAAKLPFQSQPTYGPSGRLLLNFGSLKVQ